MRKSWGEGGNEVKLDSIYEGRKAGASVAGLCSCALGRKGGPCEGSEPGKSAGAHPHFQNVLT